MPDSDRHLDARRTVSELGRKMLDQGLTKGTGGNVSQAVGDDAIAISPSGIPYDEIDPEDVPVVTGDGDSVTGDRDPSSELPMHAAVYRARPDVGGVVHTHSPYASTFASLAEPVPASHYLIGFIGDEIPVAEYATTGTDRLAETALDALGEEYNACLLANHGVLAIGDSAPEAFEVALMTEYCARIHHQARAIGEPDVLPDEEVERLREVFASYGQST